MVVPTQTIVPISTESNKTRTLSKASNQEIAFQIQRTDVIHELRSLIHDAPEGFWLGAFGLVPCHSELLVEATEEKEEKEASYGPWKDCTPSKVGDDVKTWSLTSEGVLGDFSDIDGVYADVAATSRKGLRAIPSKCLILGF